LIEDLGKGEIINSAFGADIILIPTFSSHNYQRLTATCLTWKQFFDHIQPVSESGSQ
jgi:hypothetical protein